MPGPGQMRGDGRKAANPGKTLLRLLSYMKNYTPLLVFVFLCIIATSVAQALGSRALGPLVDEYILPMVATGSTDFGALKAYLVKLACIFAFGVVGTFLFNYLMVGVTQGVQKTIRDDLFAKMQRLPLRYFDSHAAGDIMSRYTSDIDTLRQVISQSIPQCVSSVVTLVVVLWNLIDTSWILTIVMCFTVGLIIYVTKVLAGKSAGFFIGQQRALGAVNGYIEEMISGQKVVKIFNHEKVCKEDFDKLNEELRVNAYSAGKFSNMLGPINNNLGYVQYAVLAVVGGLLCVKSNNSLLTLGNLMAFMVLSRSFNMPISQISNQINAIVMALAGAERIFALMDEEPERDEGYVTLVNAHVDADGTVHECPEHTGHWAWRHPHSDGSLSYTPLQGDVRLFNVDFSYVEGKEVLHDVSVYAEPGQKVAFVGATGAGKTTITNLINRFYDIDAGTITYDGIDVRSIGKNSLRRSLGVVLQDTHLFTGTIAENIRYGRPDATDEQVVAASKLANADPFIRHLPQGYDTPITGDGGSLSQGERQLLAIARAAVSDPPVLILDEATSSIDTRTEKLIEKGMDSLMAGRTVFVIAHRLSTVQNSDAIMVLDHGRIIERGTHDDLIAQKGTYYQLYTGAFELE